jgi:glycosyltransferase involved in cell wall biosynthesis
MDDFVNQAARNVRLTVALPVFNAGKHLRLAVLSITHQTFTDWELLIIDDGSTDGALDGIADICDDRIRICRDGVNRGLAVRLNQALEMARGDFFARMDSDDVSYPERFARQLKALEADLGLDLLATRAVTINDVNQMTGLFPFARTHQDICAQPWRGFHFPHPTWMGRVEWFRRHRYGVPAAYLSEDQELLLRTYRESRFATLDEILFAYRLRDTTDWRKLAKTRKAVFASQRQQFVRTRQWRFLLLAAFSYLAKSVRDLSKQLRSGSFYPVQKADGSAVMQAWNRIRDDLLMSKTENAK